MYLLGLSATTSGVGKISLRMIVLLCLCFHEQMAGDESYILRDVRKRVLKIKLYRFKESYFQSIEIEFIIESVRFYNQVIFCNFIGPCCLTRV